MKILHPLLLTVLLFILGGTTGALWQQMILQAFESTGADVLVSNISAPFKDRALYTITTAMIAPLALGIQKILQLATGHHQWSIWTLSTVLFVGEMLSVSLRMVALATITLPHALSVAAATGAAVVLDLADATIAPWAFGGIWGAAVVLLGMLTVVGLLNPHDERS